MKTLSLTKYNLNPYKTLQENDKVYNPYQNNENFKEQKPFYNRSQPNKHNVDKKDNKFKKEFNNFDTNNTTLTRSISFKAENSTFSAILDSGADASIITKEVCDLLNIQIDNTKNNKFISALNEKCSPYGIARVA